MAKAQNEISFKPKAHILILLGEELIKSPVMAIYELIKNSYDADAKKVDVIFENIEDKDKAIIQITDDGTGINEEVLRNVWFEPGTDFRKPITADGTRTIKRSPIFNRIPMGEKGVGRFAVHKLGHKISLASRPAQIVFKDGKFSGVKLMDYEVHMEIDWRSFSQRKYLEDVKINWSKVVDKQNFKFPKSHGTHIEISSLKETWSRGMARQLKRNTISMVSPKNDNSKFKINLDFQNLWLKDFPEPAQILNKAPYKLTAFVNEDYVMTFEYDFELDRNKKLGSRHINAKNEKKKYERNIRAELRPFFRNYYERKEFEDDVIENELTSLASDKLPFGNLLFELYSFDLDAISLRDTIDSPSLVKELLKDHAGIKVFKGDLRVYDYGDPGKDWLGLDLKRVQNKEWFSNNQNIGYVYLDAETSSSLIEKTNREGFIEDSTYEHFLLILEFLLSEFRAERLSDRYKWLQFNKSSNSQSSFESQLFGLKDLINNTQFTDQNLKRNLITEAEKIESKYIEDKNTLLIPASVGMTASFAMHEIEKLVPRMQETLKTLPLNKKKIDLEVQELSDYVEGILSILKKGGIKPILLEESIKQAMHNYSLRLKLRKIEIELNLDPSLETVKCDKRLLITMIMNLIDNSIYWLDTIHKKSKGIYICTQKIEKGISIIVVDNGPGFKDNVEELVRPFFSRKEGGIGIGLYLIDTVMIQFGRLNIIYDKEELIAKGVPEKYSGAAVELIFNK